MALLLARRQQRFPSLIRFFSNSSSDPPPKSPSNSPFTDIKTSLKHLTLSLANFQRRSAAPPPKSVPPSSSLEALYKQSSSDRGIRRGHVINSSKSQENETEEMMMMTTEFLKIYREDELGEKLRRLRPEGKKEEGWFSLEELNHRLVKLRQVEEKDVKNQRGNFGVLSNVIRTFQNETAKHEDVSQSRHFWMFGSYS